jgi:hypothetical protein
MSRCLLVSLSFIAMLLAPSRSAAAQRLAPSGVQRLSTTTSVVGTLTDTNGASTGRTRGQRVARGSLIGFGVGALGGAAAFGVTYIAISNSGKAHNEVTDIIIGLSMTGAGALIGTVVGAVVGATSGP